MKIKYKHIKDPEIEKICDSEQHLLFCENFRRSFGFDCGETHEHHDKWLLEKFKKDKEKGIILSYEVIEE